MTRKASSAEHAQRLAIQGVESVFDGATYGPPDAEDMDNTRIRITWNGCEACHGAVWTDAKGMAACRGYYKIERVTEGDTDGPPDEPGCGASWRDPRGTEL